MMYYDVLFFHQMGHVFHVDCLLFAHQVGHVTRVDHVLFVHQVSHGIPVFMSVMLFVYPLSGSC